MRKKRIRSGFVFMCSLIIGFVIVWSSFFGLRIWENNSDTVNIPVDDFRYTGYEKKGNIFTSTQEDPQIQVTMEGAAYKYLYINVGNISDMAQTQLQVFYTETGEYSEQNSVKAMLKSGENRICFPRSVKLSGLRIDIGTAAGLSFELKEVVCTNRIIFSVQFWIRLIVCELLIGLCWILGLNYGRIKCYVLNHKWEVGILCLAFGVYYIWSMIIPYNQAPDEYMRYDVAQYIYTYHSLPRGDDPVLCNNEWGIGYAFLPYLSYLISACFMFVADAIPISQFGLFHVARLASVVFSTITVYYCIQIAKQILNERSGKLFVVMVGFLPQFVFISSYVNNDSLALMSTAMIVYYWILGLQTKWNLKNCIGLGAALAICVASYRNVYGYGLCSALFFVCYYLVQYQKTKDVSVFREMLKKGLIICGVVILISGWWFVRNYMIYDGDIMGRSAAKLAKLKYAAEQHKPGVQKNLYQQGISLKYMFYDMGWLKTCLTSFVAAFGYMDLWLPAWCYNLYFAIFGAGCLGHVLTWKKRKKPIFNKLLLTMMWIAMGIVFFLSVYYSYFIDYQAQGRYLLPIIVPLMLLLSTGIEKLEKLIQEMTRKHIPLIKIVMVFFVVSTILVLINIIIPNYYWIEELIPEYFWHMTK